MSESTLTPATAPRTLEGLMQETPFKLRVLLTDHLGGLSTEEQKMAWHHMTNNEARANYVLSLLKQWDAANPGVAQPAPMNGAHAPAPNPATQTGFMPPGGGQTFGAPTPGFSIPQNGFVSPQPIQPVPASMAAAPGGPPAVSPQAAAQAAAATQAEKTTSRRQPRTGGASAQGDADVGAEVVSMLQTILSGLGSEAGNRMAWQKQITDMLEEAATSKGSRVTALEQKYGELAQALHALAQAQQTQQQLQIWTLMAFLTLAEQQTGVGIAQILGAAISDSAMFQKLVESSRGKAQ